MPELPEVETCRRGITPHITGEVIARITVRNSALRWPVPCSQLTKLKGEKILSVERVGKYLKLLVSSGQILIHLGMSGSLRILDKPDAPPGKHDHIDLITASGTCLRYNDPRRFGCWLFHDHPETRHPLLATLGVEPLSKKFTGDYLFEKTRKRKAPIKNLIMDSHVVTGVGNIYACESLFMAGISPKRPAGRVSAPEAERLVEAIRKVLLLAIEQGGTTLRDFVGSDGKPGYFRQQLAVYGREGDSCPQCGLAIDNIRIGQRSSFFCPRCQK